MTINSARTLICCVLYLDIEEYATRPVVEQLAMKKKFNQLLSEALRDVAADDRIVLDTGDGAAVCFLSEPENALFAAMIFRDEINAQAADETPVLKVRTGINLGPVRLLKDINGRINIIGDGINDAQRVMSFAESGKILTSRSYFEVVSRISEDFARLFAYDGTRTDKHIREHTLYAVGSSFPGALPLPQHEPRDPRAEAMPSAALPRTAAPPRKSRNQLILASVAAAVLLGGAALAVLWRPGDGPVQMPDPTPTSPASQPAPLPMAAEPAPAPPPEKATAPAARRKAPQPAAEKPPAAPPSGGTNSPETKPAAARAEARKPTPPARKAPGDEATPAWVGEMRKELAACSHFICTERVRWKYCPQANWDTYDECRNRNN